MTRRVVVGWNGSPAADAALDWAVDWTRKTDRSLVAVLCAERNTDVDGLEERLGTRLARIRLTEPRLDLDGEVVHRGAELALEERSAADTLLVLGEEERYFGSGTGSSPLATRLAASAHGPVAIIPAPLLGTLDDRRGVVVGVDGSRVSVEALRFAAEAARELQEPLVAVFAWEPSVAHPARDRNPAALRAYERVLEEAVEEVLPAFPDVPVERRVREGRPITVLMDASTRARLLVVGSRGHGSVARFLLGSVSSIVLGASQGPVVIVPRRTRTTAPAERTTMLQGDPAGS